MTGFVALFGRDSSTCIDVEKLTSAATSMREPLELVHSDAHAALYTTIDLPAYADQEGRMFAVGDIDTEPSSDSLRDGRRRSLDRLVRSLDSGGSTLDTPATDHHYIVFDAVAKVMIAGHDFAGIKPLFFRQEEGLTTIVSSLRFMLACHSMLELDEASIRRFVVGDPPAPGRTFYTGVSRLKPGERLTFSGGGVKREVADRALHPVALASKPDLVANYRKLFEAAVTKRLRSGDLAALLSGGLDSSSIAVVAREHVGMLKTLSLVFDSTPQWNERHFIEAVVSESNIRSQIYDVEDFRPFQAMEKLFQQQGGLFLAPGLTLTHRLYGLAQQSGIDVLLDGHGGDEIVSHGYAHMTDLVNEGAWRELFHELRRRRDATFASAAVAWLLEVWRSGPARPLAKMIARGRRRLRRVRRGGSVAAFTFPLLAPQQRQALLSEARRDAPATSFSWETDEHRQHFEQVSNPIQAAGFEVLHASSSAEGICLRFPFWDRDFSQFCLSLPGRMKVRDGFTRWILRDALPELPPLVRWRKDKLDFTPHHAIGLLRELSVLEALTEKGGVLERYVDLQEARRHLRILVRKKANTPGDTVQALWRVGVLGLWLKSRALAAAEARG